MKRQILRTTVAAAVVAVAGAANAAMDGANKVSMDAGAEPAARAVDTTGEQLATMKAGEKAATKCEAPAARAAGQAGDQTAVQDKGEKCY